MKNKDSKDTRVPAAEVSAFLTQAGKIKLVIENFYPDHHKTALLFDRDDFLLIADHMAQVAATLRDKQEEMEDE